MAQIRLTGTMREIASALDRIAAIGRNPSRVLAAVGEEMIQSTQLRFETQTAPDGTPWAPLNPHYAADKAATRPGAGILTYTQHLRRGISRYVDGRTLVWGSNLDYAAVHQFGAVIKPKSRKALFFSLGGREVMARSVTIPARPYLGFTAEDRLTVIEELEDALARAMRA
ncbi:MAG: phage virion morphogenesis protein [Gluconacetobacter sp.]